MENEGKLKKYTIIGGLICIAFSIILPCLIYIIFQNSTKLTIKGVIHGDEISYTAATDGVVENWLVDENVEVKQGISVITIKSKVTKEQLEALEEDYQKAKIEYEIQENRLQKYSQMNIPARNKHALEIEDNSTLKEKIKKTRYKVERMEQLVKSGAVSQRELQRVKEDLFFLETKQKNEFGKVNRENIAVPDSKVILDFAQLQNRYQELKEALIQVKNKDNIVELHAPLTGKLVAINYKKGEEFKKGDKIFTIDTRRNLALYCKIEEKLKAKIHPGLYVRYSIKKQEFDGIIENVFVANGVTWGKIILPKTALKKIENDVNVDVTISLDNN